jgi:hypothetical protein
LMPGTTLQEADAAALRIKRGIEDSAEAGSPVTLHWESSPLVRERVSLR